MAKTSGFTQIAIMAAGTLLNTPTGVLLFGICKNEDMKVSDHRAVKIDRDEHEWPNMKNIMLVGESLQPSLYMFNKLIEYRGGNCDIQIISLNGSVFQFLAASNPLGIEPKYILNDDVRSIQVDIEGAFPKSIWDAIELAAQTNTAEVLAALQSGRDSTKMREVYPLATQSPSTVEIFDHYTKRSLEIAAKRKAKVMVTGTNSSNISIYDRLIATAIIQMEDATFNDHYNQRGKGDAPELLFKDNNDASYYDLIQFAADTLVQKVDYNNSGTKSELTVTYKGAVPIEGMSLETGTGKGDAVGGTGIAGGTLKFNY